MNYEPVIGLEVHLQVKTKTKMFSREPADYFQEAPNTRISPVSFGLPGALPVPNKVAFHKAIKLALALNCSINQHTKFDRKNYFYPDLAKGYQISQFDKPIGFDGYVEIEIGDDARRIRLQRLHLEEDTAKSMHNENETLIDFNKSGIPLIEMVTDPDFASVEEVLQFAYRLRQIVRYTDTSDAEMQKGQMRFELNISVRKVGEKGLPPYKVEVKNIGSISVLEKVIGSEIERQSKILDTGDTPQQETRGLIDMSGATKSQRTKEEAADYRYFPEPDIPPIFISNELITQLKDEIPELPHERKARYRSLNLESEQADIFVENTDRGDYLDTLLSDVPKEKQAWYAKESAKWINGDIAGWLIKKSQDFSQCPIVPQDLVVIIDLVHNKKITGTVAKNVIEEIFQQHIEAKAGTVESIIEEKGWMQIQDDAAIEVFATQVIQENEKVVADIEKNPNAIKFLVGQVMKLSKGRANPQTAEELLKKELGL